MFCTQVPRLLHTIHFLDRKRLNGVPQAMRKAVADSQDLPGRTINKVTAARETFGSHFKRFESVKQGRFTNVMILQAVQMC